MVLLEIAGKKPKEIAEIVDMSISRVSVILGDRRAEIERLSLAEKLSDQITDIHTKLQLYAHEALETVIDEMRAPENKSELRVKVGFGILDRAGFTPVQKQVVAHAEIPVEIAERMEIVASELKENRPVYEKVKPKIDEAEFEVMEDD